MELAEIKKQVLTPSFKKNFIEMMGINEGKFKVEIGFALQQIEANPAILKADAKSVLTAIMNAARVGLSLNPAQKQAYLIPRFNRGGVKAHLEPSYMGLIHLAIGNSIKTIEANTVRENDLFEMDGRMQVSKHLPYWANGHSKPGKIIAVYSVATLPDGLESFEFMGAHEVEQIKQSSESWKAYKAGKIKTCVWVDHEGEMTKKTVLKRHLKRLQSGDKQLSEAIELSDTDWSVEPTHSQISYAESMIERAAFSAEQKAELLDELTEADAARVSEIIEDCKATQANDGKTENGLTAEQTAHLNTIEL